MKEPSFKRQPIEVIEAPVALWQFVRVDRVSPTARRLGAWPEKVYAGRHLAGGLGRAKRCPADRV